MLFTLVVQTEYLFENLLVFYSFKVGSAFPNFTIKPNWKKWLLFARTYYCHMKKSIFIDPQKYTCSSLLSKVTMKIKRPEFLAVNNDNCPWIIVPRKLSLGNWPSDNSHLKKLRQMLPTGNFYVGQLHSRQLPSGKFTPTTIDMIFWEFLTFRLNFLHRNMLTLFSFPRHTFANFQIT